MALSERDRDFNQRQRERRAKTCEHFNGIVNAACKLGIDYRKLGDDSRPGMALRLPCMPSREPHEQAECEHFCARGMEKVLAESAESNRRFKQTSIARAAIVKATDGMRGLQGVIECPCCPDGRLSYSIAGSNGHIWGTCSTEHCVRWME